MPVTSTLKIKSFNVAAQHNSNVHPYTFQICFLISSVSNIKVLLFPRICMFGFNQATRIIFGTPLQVNVPELLNSVQLRKFSCFINLSILFLSAGRSPLPSNMIGSSLLWLADDYSLKDSEKYLKYSKTNILQMHK